MNSKRKNIIAIIGAICLLGLLPLFLRQMQPIPVEVPQVSQEKATVQEELPRAEVQQPAVVKPTKPRRMFRCETDEECIIVDKDPCGCLVGPAGVVAINASYTLEFNQLNEKIMTKACPETEPSTEKECSPEARPVCQANVCKIIY